LAVLRGARFNQQRSASIAGKLLAALLACGLIWLIAADVMRIAALRHAGNNAPPPLLSTAGSAQTVIAANLFGASSTTQPADARPTSLNLRLKGVYAATGDFSGFAIISVDGRPDIGIVKGSEIKPGVKLNAVNADHILIVHDGLVERVDLGSYKPGAAPAAPAATSQSVHVQAITGSKFSVSRGEFTSLLSDPRQVAMLALLGTNPGGGIVINDAVDAGLMGKLGLRQGDIIQKINGQTVAGKDDLLKIVMDSPATNEVSVEGTRSGLPLRLTYNVQP
jgi:general secretion pathway protein C